MAQSVYFYAGVEPKQTLEKQNKLPQKSFQSEHWGFLNHHLLSIFNCKWSFSYRDSELLAKWNSTSNKTVWLIQLMIVWLYDSMIVDFWLIDVNCMIACFMFWGSTDFWCHIHLSAADWRTGSAAAAGRLAGPNAKHLGAVKIQVMAFCGAKNVEKSGDKDFMFMIHTAEKVISLGRQYL